MPVHNGVCWEGGTWGQVMGSTCSEDAAEPSEALQVLERENGNKDDLTGSDM